MFSKPEIDYLKYQLLARIATVNSDGQPDVVPVGLEFDGENFWIGSHDQDIFFRRIKYKNVKNGNKLVSLVIDDLESVDPWKPRCVKVYGLGEVMDHEGQFGKGKYLRVVPKISWSFGLPGLKPTKDSFRQKTIHKYLSNSICESEDECKYRIRYSYMDSIEYWKRESRISAWRIRIWRNLPNLKVRPEGSSFITSCTRFL